MSVAFIGLGLNDEGGLTIEGLEEARLAKTVFAEFYTSIMPGLDRKKLEGMIGKKIDMLSRIDLEDKGAKRIVDAVGRGGVAFLVPGDPMIATTHISVRLELRKRGISSKIIHGPSIMSAVCGATCLQSYKFGKSVTLPQEAGVPGSLLDTVRDNRTRDLHTLILLDVRPESLKQLNIGEAAAKLVAADPALGNMLAVGVARIGSEDQLVRSARLGKLQNQDFGRIPHCLVIPGKLHFIEAEALKVFCGAEDADLEGPE
jgi:diphthine synthase